MLAEYVFMWTPDPSNDVDFLGSHADLLNYPNTTPVMMGRARCHPNSPDCCTTFCSLSISAYSTTPSWRCLPALPVCSSYDPLWMGDGEWIWKHSLSVSVKCYWVTGLGPFRHDSSVSQTEATPSVWLLDARIGEPETSQLRATHSPRVTWKWERGCSYEPRQNWHVPAAKAN